MHLTIFLVIFILQGIYVKGKDLNKLFGRLICYNDTQENCTTNFIDVYKNLSRSVTNVTDAETFMLLFTRRSKEPEKLHKCGGKLPPNSAFDPEKETIVIYIPFIGSFCNVAVYREWVRQLLIHGDYNIIVIDYSWGNQLDYATAVLNALYIVANQTLILLNNIQEAPYKKLTFIGHSLGAQLAARVGYLYWLANKQKPDLIIGLDPAGPGFDKDKTSEEKRLDLSDAKLVIVWHCNAGACLPDFGIDYDAGHINFYINGGTKQYSTCYAYSVGEIFKGDVLYGFGTLLLPSLCSHAQCAPYFQVSINPGNCSFVGVLCQTNDDCKYDIPRNCGINKENTLIMGFDTDKYIKAVPSTPQKYFVRTSPGCPFCDKYSPSCLIFPGK